MILPEDSDVFERCKKNAEMAIFQMREVALEIFGERSDIIIGVNGSVARREYTSGSDVDHFFLSAATEPVDISCDEEAFCAKLKERGLKMPAAGGVFEGALPVENLLRPIGGNDDSNKTLTRRMLFLLEGEWIFNQGAFEDLRGKLIAQYVTDDLETNKLALYLLNDIIRYWRTICIDFENKTSDGIKPRAIRLTKLRVSRMLLCFAGMIAVAEANDLSALEKRRRLVELFSKQGIDRLESLLDDRFFKARDCYGIFLEKLDDPKFRCALELEGAQGMETQEYRDMVELARDFKSELVGILLDHYGSKSVIVKAILL
jgi:hypothetical protein